MHRGFIPSCLLGTLLFFLSPMTSFAQPTPVGGELQVNTTTALDQKGAQVAMDANGKTVVVWQDGGYTTPGLDGSSLGVIGQRYDSSGNAIGGEFIVNSDTLGNQQAPDVAMDADGNFVVVWVDGADFGGDGDGGFDGIAGRLFDSNGNPVGDQFTVNNITARQQLQPDVSMGPDGGFIVAWTDGQPSPVSFEIYARLFDSSGAPLGGQFQVNTFTTDRQQRADTGFDANGNFVIAWTSETDRVEEDEDIIARRYDSAGNPLSGELVINSHTPDRQREVSLAVGDAGDFVATWQARGVDGSSESIAARRFDSAGTPLAADFQVNTYTYSAQESPSIARDGLGNFTIVWSSYSQDGSAKGIFGQEFDSAGNATGSEFRVNTTTFGNQGYGFRDVNSAMDNDGNFTVVWADEGAFAQGGTPPGQDGDGAGVFAQRFVGNFSNDALIGHWPLDEGSGSTAADTSSNGLHGALEGAASWTPGQQASGGLFDGNNSLIRVADSGVDSPIDVTDSLTIALWVRPDGVDGSIQTLVSKDDAYELEFGKLGASTWDLRLDNIVVYSGSTPIEGEVWQHLAVTWDGAQVCGYYNGLLDSCSAYAGSLIPNNRDLGFGGRPSPLVEGGPVFHFEGALDEIYLYNFALSDTDIADLVLDELTDIFPPVRSHLAPSFSLAAGTTAADLSLDTDEDATCRYDTSAGTSFGDMANAFTTTGGTGHSSSVAVSDGVHTFYVRCQDGLGNTNGEDAVIVFGVGDVDLCAGQVSSWLLDEGSGCTAADAVGSNDGTLGPNCPTNAPTWSSGHLGSNGALHYDGDDDLVTIANDASFATPTGFTLSAWIKHSPNTWYRSILDLRDSGSDGYDLYVSPNSKGFVRANDLILEGNTDIADNTWHHVVGTYDGTTLRLYVDGVLDASSVVGGTSLNVTADIKLGHHFSSTNNTLVGELGEVGLWDRALTETEVLDQSFGAVCDPTPVCPCIGHPNHPVWTSLAADTAVIEGCLDAGAAVYVLAQPGVVSAGFGVGPDEAGCASEGEPIYTDQATGQVCADLLFEKAALQGIPCNHP